MKGIGDAVEKKADGDVFVVGKFTKTIQLSFHMSTVSHARRKRLYGKTSPGQVVRVDMVKHWLMLPVG